MREVNVGLDGKLSDHWKRMSAAEVFELGAQLCAQLPSESGACHGGIWPGNIFVTTEGEFVLGEGVNASVTEMPPDEVEFMAPEYFWESERSPAGDVYSVGMVMFAAFCGGRLPFQKIGQLTSQERAKALRRRMKGERVNMPKNMDAALAQAISHAVEYETESRTVSPARFAAELDTLKLMLDPEKKPEDKKPAAAAAVTAAAAAAATAAAVTAEPDVDDTHVWSRESIVKAEEQAAEQAMEAEKAAETPMSASGILLEAEVAAIGAEKGAPEIAAPTNGPRQVKAPKKNAGGKNARSGGGKPAAEKMVNRTPEKAPEKAPEKTPEKAPEKTANRAANPDTKKSAPKPDAKTAAASKTAAKPDAKKSAAKPGNKADAASKSAVKAETKTGAKTETKKAYQVDKSADKPAEKNGKLKKFLIPGAAAAAVLAVVLLIVGLSGKSARQSEPEDAAEQTPVTTIIPADEVESAQESEEDEKAVEEDDKTAKETDDKSDDTDAGDEKDAEDAEDEKNAEAEEKLVVTPEPEDVDMPEGVTVTPDVSVVVPVATATPRPVATATPAPVEVITSDDGAYTIRLADMSWEQAESYCREQNGTLGVIANDEQFETVTALADKLGVDYVWLGAELGEDGVWRWADGTELSQEDLHWGASEPNGSQWEPPENKLMLVRENGAWVYNDVASDIFSLQQDVYSGNVAFIIQQTSAE